MAMISPEQLERKKVLQKGIAMLRYKSMSIDEMIKALKENGHTSVHGHELTKGIVYANLRIVKQKTKSKKND